jgi:trans-aconitate 2-methyltransferase
LDIGFGDGRVTAKLVARVQDGSRLGIDNSTDLIDFARKMFPPFKYTNLRFLLRIFWIMDHLTVLRGVKRSLRPGGLVLFHCGCKGMLFLCRCSATDSGVKDLAKDVVRDDRWSRYFGEFIFPYSLYGPEEHHAWLNRAGLEELRTELVSKEIILPGKIGLETYSNTWNTVRLKTALLRSG